MRIVARDMHSKARVMKVSRLENVFLIEQDQQNNIFYVFITAFKQLPEQQCSCKMKQSASTWPQRKIPQKTTKKFS